MGVISPLRRIEYPRTHACAYEEEFEWLDLMLFVILFEII